MEIDKRKSAGKFLQKRREALNLSQEQVARSSGLSPTTISQIEHGGGAPRPGVVTLRKLAAGYQIPLEDARRAYMVTLREEQEATELEVVLLEMMADEKYADLKEYLEPVLAEGMSINTIRLVVRLYELVYKDKPLMEKITRLREQYANTADMLQTEYLKVDINKNPKAFGKVLAKIRVEAKINQRNMAARIGISKTALHALETGAVKTPTSDILQKIARGFNMKSEDIEKAFVGEPTR